MDQSQNLPPPPSIKNKLFTTGNKNTFKATSRKKKTTEHYLVKLKGFGWNVAELVPRRGFRSGGRVLSGGSERFYESQCKSRDKYYLLFEEKALEVPTVQRESLVCMRTCSSSRRGTGPRPDWLRTTTSISSSSSSSWSAPRTQQLEKTKDTSKGKWDTMDWTQL